MKIKPRTPFNAIIRNILYKRGDCILKNISEYNEERIIRNKFTIISFVCSIFVIFIHACNLRTYGITEESSGIARIVYLVENYWSNINNLAVPMFFCISGLLFYRTFEINKLFEKWKSRLITICFPYLIWCSLYYIYNVICTNVPAIKLLMKGSQVVELSLSNWISWLWVSEYYTLWFLKNLIVFIGLAPVIWLLLKNHSDKIPTGLIILVLLSALFNSGIITFECLNGLDFYLVGSYIGLNCRDFLKYKNKKASVISLIFLIGSLFLPFALPNFIVRLLIFIAIWFALDLIDLECIKCYWWMYITFFIYVCHDAFLESFKKVIWKVGGNNAALALLGYLFLPFVMYVFLTFVAYVMRRYIPMVWNITTGNRGKEQFE